MKYAHYKKLTGELLGWYADDVHSILIEAVPEVLNQDGTVLTPAIPEHYDTSTIPTPHMIVSDIDWANSLENNFNHVDAITGKMGIGDFRSLTEIRDAKLLFMKTSYENSNELDIAYMGTLFQADKKSQDLIVSVLSAGAVPNGFFWNDKYNNQIPVTYIELQGLSSAILTRNQINFVKLQTLKTLAKAATTQTELDKVVWL